MLARDLIDDALSKARDSSPLVRACAHLHIARVLTRFNGDEAHALLRESIDELEQLSLNPFDREALDREIYMLTGAVAPELAANRRKPSRPARHITESEFVRTLLAHEHLNAAIAHLMSYSDPSVYPHMSVAMVMHECADPGVKIALLRRSLQAWHDGMLTAIPALPKRQSRDHTRSQQEFLRLFAYHWSLLPEEEALQGARDLVSFILNAEDTPIQASFDLEARVSFTSGRQYQLFEILHILRRLDTALGDSLMDRHPELAAAAALFPFGMDSVKAAWEARSASHCEPACGGSFVMGGSEADMAFGHALMNARRSNQFDPALDQVMNVFHEDLESNAAVRECWPSIQSCRILFHEIGKLLGSDGITYLERIPDPDLRIFAQIEFAAALAGLPAHSGVRISFARQAGP